MTGENHQQLLDAKKRRAEATQEAHYALTLPFRSPLWDQTPCPATRRALEQTKARWHWFEKAAQLDEERCTALGTLGYLSWEIRRQILSLIVVRNADDGYTTRSIASWKFRPALSGQGRQRKCRLDKNSLDHLEMLQPWDYAGGKVPPKDHVKSLLRFSKTLAFEFGDMFLSTNTFHFYRPATLSKFIETLHKFRSPRLLRICLSLFIKRSYTKDPTLRRQRETIAGWLELFNKLPPSLMNLSIELGDDIPVEFEWLPFQFFCSSGRMLKAREFDRFYWKLEKVQTPPKRSLKRLLTFLETIAHRAKRSAPKAAIWIGGYNFDELPTAARASCQNMVSDLNKGPDRLKRRHEPNSCVR